MHIYFFSDCWTRNDQPGTGEWKEPADQELFAGEYSNGGESAELLLNGTGRAAGGE